MRQRNNHKTFLLLIAFGFLFPTFVCADIIPRGTKPIPVLYRMLPPKDLKSHVYLWRKSSIGLLPILDIEAVQWNAAKPKQYSRRTLLYLLSFDRKQAHRLIQFLLQQKEFKNERKRITKMPPKEQIKWLRQLTFTAKITWKKASSSLSPKSQLTQAIAHPLYDYLNKKENVTAQLELRTTTLVAEHSPATEQLRVVQIVKTEKNKIIWKAKDKLDHDKNKQVVPTIVGKGAYIVTRWKMVLLGFLLALAVALFLRQRRLI